jgi:hypothetical protein
VSRYPELGADWHVRVTKGKLGERLLYDIYRMGHGSHSAYLFFGDDT